MKFVGCVNDATNASMKAFFNVSAEPHIRPNMDILCEEIAYNKDVNLAFPVGNGGRGRVGGGPGQGGRCVCFRAVIVMV